MFKYVFKLKSSYSPDLTNPSDSDKSKGGIRLTYSITLVYYFTWVKLFKGKELQVVYFRRKLGNKTFLRPFKKYWDKRTYRLPRPYWGKTGHPLTRLWVTLRNDAAMANNKIIPEASLQHKYVNIFGHSFVSKQITANLMKKRSKFSIIKNQNV